MILQAPVDGGSHGSYQEPLALAFLWGFLFGRKDFPKGEPIETSRITFLRSKVLMMSSQRGITWVSKLSFDSLNHLGEPMSFWIKMGTSRPFFFGLASLVRIDLRRRGRGSLRIRQLSGVPPQLCPLQDLFGTSRGLFLNESQVIGALLKFLKFQPAIFRGFGLMIWSPSLEGGLLMVGFFSYERGGSS